MSDAPSRFRRGVEAVKTASTSTGSFGRTGYFKLDDGERAFVQFISDPYEWIPVDMHNRVPTKSKPVDFEGNWPEFMNAVCRHTKGENKLGIYPDCYICENLKNPRDPAKPFQRTSRTWAIAVLKEEVIGDGSAASGGEAKKGKRVGFRNKKIEVPVRGADGKPTGEMQEKPEVVFVTMGWKNFFAALEGTAQVHDGSITHLIFAIQRSGEMLDTTYSITSMGEQRVKGGKVVDFSDPEFASQVGVTITGERDSEGSLIKKYAPDIDIVKLLDERSSDEYYAKFFDTGKSVPSQSRQAAVKPRDEEPASLAEMKQRILGYAPEEPAPTSEVKVSSDEEAEFDLDEA